PLEVANLLADMGMDKTTIAAGLLHDVLEDTRVTAPELQKVFGKEIAHLVEGVTKLSRVQESSPETRQAESVQRIIITMTDDLRIIFIKLADRIHNLQTLKYLPQNKQKKIAEETLDIYAPIANRLGMGRIKAELEDLAFQYVDSDYYEKIESFVQPKRKEAEADLKKIKREITREMKDNNIPAEISFRIKRSYSIYKKLQRQKIEFTQVYDLMALRLITDSVKNCYATLGLIHQKWPHLPHRFRDFIAMPKPNLYQALHTTIITEQKKMFEIQIRTRDMHHLAENGIAAHWKYKEADQQAMLKDDQRIIWLRELVDLYKEQKNPQEFLRSLKTDLTPEEIYVFTPNGQVITLPLGASALDFAYCVHTEIGLHATGVTINGRHASLKTILKTGDIIEILTSSNIQTERTWLNIAFTSRARHHITHWLNQQRKSRDIAIGKQIWKEALSSRGQAISRHKIQALLDKISGLTNIHLQGMFDLFGFLGSGKIDLTKKLLDKIFSSGESVSRDKPLLEKVVSSVAQKTKSGPKKLASEKGNMKLAKCCSPIKGEPIVGYMTGGKGITIHAQRCRFILNRPIDRHRLFDMIWDQSLKGLFRGKLLMRGKNYPGLLAKVTAIIAELGGNIIKANVETFSNQEGQIRLIIEIKNINHLQSIISRLLQIKEITSVDRF
ncbi:MAG: bifunctional (p)ppGpp synthetase/guanosine-3',5'-bis(diphosphate) 3'-pyrophosphohydrolase, partial [Candidatus Aminicenantes bacterium]|nr:bifunctional (p)ppGpp synthetase/guanosine-3',5'-bis(diphosphate) 3'-pyrophosphohydrolase [Candidatus Aminicenantes bacterium]